MKLRRALDKGRIYFIGALLATSFEAKSAREILLSHAKGETYLDQLEKEAPPESLSLPPQPPLKV